MLIWCVDICILVISDLVYIIFYGTLFYQPFIVLFLYISYLLLFFVYSLIVLLVYLVVISMLILCFLIFSFFFFKQKTAYEMRISDWSSDVCSSDLPLMRTISKLLSAHRF